MANEVQAPLIILRNTQERNNFDEDISITDISPRLILVNGVTGTPNAFLPGVPGNSDNAPAQDGDQVWFVNLSGGTFNVVYGDGLSSAIVPGKMAMFSYSQLSAAWIPVFIIDRII